VNDLSPTTSAATPPATDSTADSEVVELSLQVRSAVGRLYRRVRSQLAAGELGETAMVALTRLSDEGPQTLTALSGALQVTLASMSQTVNRLTEAGYAARSPDPDDGRRVLLAATPVGRRLARVSRARRHAWLQARIAALGPDDQAALARAATLLSAIADDPK
jgi:DNA-binding MarR family transcriptional regulator